MVAELGRSNNQRRAGAAGSISLRGVGDFGPRAFWPTGTRCLGFAVWALGAVIFLVCAAFVADVATADGAVGGADMQQVSDPEGAAEPTDSDG